MCACVCAQEQQSSSKTGLHGSQISVALKYLGFNYKKFHPIKTYDTCRPKHISYCQHKFCSLQQVAGGHPKSSEAFSCVVLWLETGHSLLGQELLRGLLRWLLSSSHCVGKESWQECGFCSSKRDLLIFVSLGSSSNAQPSHTPQKGHGTPRVGQH